MQEIIAIGGRESTPTDYLLSARSPVDIILFNFHKIPKRCYLPQIRVKEREAQRG